MRKLSFSRLRSAISGSLWKPLTTHALREELHPSQPTLSIIYLFYCNFLFFSAQLYTSVPSVLCLTILLFLLLQYQTGTEDMLRTCTMTTRRICFTGQVPVDHRIYAWVRSINITRHQFGCLEKQQHQTERRQVSC